jgi:CRP/FNR family cyclic AMP-dependent transcriptional regulator
MPHDIVREHRVVLSRKKCRHISFDFVGILLRGPTEAPRQSPEMRIDRDSRDTECIAEHNIRSLAPHTREADQRIEVRRDVTSEVIAQALPDLLDRLRLLPEEPGGSDQSLQVPTVSRRVARSIGVLAEQSRRHLVDPLVSALRTQHSRDQQLQRRPEIQLAVRVGIGRSKFSEYGPCLGAVCDAVLEPRSRYRPGNHASRVCVFRATPRSASLPSRPRPNERTKGRFVDDVLAGTPLFSALDPQGAEALRVSLQEIRVAKGQELFREGEPGDHLYVILEGKVKLGQGSPDGRESLMAVLGPGEMFGELSLFDPGLRTSTATALTEATVLALGNEQLMPLLEGRPEVAAALLQALARRLRRTNEAMADLVFSDVPGRVAKALMELGEKFGTLTPEGLLVTHDMTQEEIAQLVGASRETVNKALADFGHRGWIKLESRQVLITDVDRLGKRAR